MSQNDYKVNIKGKTLLILSISVCIYLALLILSYRLKFDSIVIVGALREFLDIPAFILLAVLFVFSIIAFIKGKFRLNSFPFYSIILLLAITAAMILFL